MMTVQMLGATALAQEAIDTLAKQLANNTVLTSFELADILRAYDTDTRARIQAAYIAAGGDQHTIQRAMSYISENRPTHSHAYGFISLISLISGAACTYHGYKRNNSIGWALGWGALGAIFWPTAVIALAQGFGKPK